MKTLSRAIPKGTLRIVKYPSPILRERCAPVSEFMPELADFGRRMLQLMREAKGVGLAAPQVGVNLRMFVCNHTGEPEDDMICINPELSAPAPPAEAEEGCLSIPDVSVAVRRPEAITITARTPSGESFQRTGGDLLARVWQHETDHLNGRLIIDYMSEAEEISNRRALKHLKDTYRP